MLGVSLGMLIARKKGTELQKSILESIDGLGREVIDFKEKIQTITNSFREKASSVKDNVGEKVDHVKEGINDVKTTADHLKSIFS